MDIQSQKLDPWLQNLVGEWTYEVQDLSSADKSAEPVRGVETVRPSAASGSCSRDAATCPEPAPPRA